MVISLEMIEMGYRGSKSDFICKSVKEQGVDGDLRYEYTPSAQ